LLASDAADLEALTFQFVMFHQLVSSAVISVPFVQNVLANFIKRLCNVQVQSKKFLCYLRVYLSILVVHLLFRDEM
jgi:hypothetical protein